MSDREAHRAAVEAGYASPAVTPHAIPIKHDVFAAMKEAADSKGWSAADQINLALRQWLGWER